MLQCAGLLVCYTVLFHFVSSAQDTSAKNPPVVRDTLPRRDTVPGIHPAASDTLTGQAVPIMTAYGVLQRQAWPFLLSNTYNIAPNKLTYAIPFREIQTNPGLSQNPGY
jgi:hypothetical protein